MKEVKLVGYWNGDINNPEITFDIPEKSVDNKQLVVMTLQVIPEDKFEDIRGTLNNNLNKLGKINKELKNLCNASRRILK